MAFEATPPDVIAAEDAATSYGPCSASVVVVDDRATNRNILARLAQQLARQVAVRDFADPQAALDSIRGESPDIVITDYRMPAMNGAEFVRRLAALPGGAEIPVIVVTAYEDKEYRYDALKAGASDFLLTPLDRLEFIHRARNLLMLRWQQTLLKSQAEALERQVQRTNALRQQEQQHSEAKFRAVIDTLPALVNAADGQGHFVFLNAYHARVFGLCQDDTAGAPLAERLPNPYAKRHTDANAKVFKTGESLTFEEVVPTQHGASCTFQTSKAPLRNEAGRIAYVVTVSVDITERKRTERELAAAKEAAQRANQAKTEFLANISHELRTPLNAIIGFSHITGHEMLGPIGNPKYLEYQTDIHSSAQHLLGLIDDLLDVSKLELGRIKVYRETVKLAGLIEQEVRGFVEDARINGLSLDYVVAPDIGEVVTDPTRLRQILGNLISNGLKFTSAGGRVTVDAARRDGETVAITVTDTGIGMTGEEIKVALSRFGRVASPETQSRPGAGLGLPIAAELARLLGGRLDVASRRGEGTAVTLQLPVGADTHP